ncbi:hypothetical protein HFP57_17460 [Parasphingopyxis algicola]|uniref:DUF6716 putative glycosyltransferase n=1 Tax=Parasphingopyxis algicola TaxID=2026624 RepID=UPI0015A0C21F|nr:DUF6716 putative glycosyltransferase [Parasphingopyxis algicola]QLC26645.1 hypothetical protein HFP57_17460 [Parasphingopyxis algicola]
MKFLKNALNRELSPLGVVSNDSQSKMAKSLGRTLGQSLDTIELDDFLQQCTTGTTDHDALICFIAARDMLVLWLHLHHYFAHEERPLIISYPVGINLPGVIVGAYQFRECADLVVCANSSEAELANSLYSDMSATPPRTTVTKLPIFGDKTDTAERISERLDKADRFVFFGQPDIPNLAEAEYIVSKLERLADQHRDKVFLIKPRFMRGEKFTAHKPKYNYETVFLEIVEKRERRLPNFAITFEPVESLISDGTVALSVSSTALLEAASSGIPAVALTDLGIRETLGNSYFMGSGMLRNLESLFGDEPYKVNSSWLEDKIGNQEVKLQLQAPKRSYNDSFWARNEFLPISELDRYARSKNRDISSFGDLVNDPDLFRSIIDSDGHRPIDRARALKRKKKYDEAIKISLNVVQEDPKNGLHMRNLVETYILKGSYGEAAKWLEKLKAHKGENFPPAVELTEMLTASQSAR